MAEGQLEAFVHANKRASSSLNQTHTPQSKMDFMWETPANSSAMELDLFPSALESTVLPILYCFLCAFGLAGNVLVIYVVSNFSKMRTVANVYLLNLAVADVLFLLVLPFLATDVILMAWPFGDFMCRSVVLATNINGFASFFSLAVLSVDRYYATVQPLQSLQYRTVSKARWVSVGVWSVALVLVCPFIVFARTAKDTDGAEHCIVDWPGTSVDPSFGSQVAITYSFVLGFAVPLLFIAVCYALIIFRLRAKGPIPPNGVTARSRNKITVMVCAVVLAFTVCWLPYHIFNIVRISAGLDVSLSVRQTALVVNLLAFCNSAINPLIYHCLGENFRKGFRRVCLPFSSNSSRKSTRRTVQTSLSSIPRQQVGDIELNNLGYSLFQRPMAKITFPGKPPSGDNKTSGRQSRARRRRGVTWSPQTEPNTTKSSKENPQSQQASLKIDKGIEVDDVSVPSSTASPRRSRDSERQEEITACNTTPKEPSVNSQHDDDIDKGSNRSCRRKTCTGLSLCFPNKSRRFHVASWKHAPDKTAGDSLAKLTKFKVVNYREQWV
ncbi:SSTR2 [Branchiostoma lanceolatum]|uniref:SSTR2 protein n=1 Tax=Branchiostoma lanceolatum TaxID=7740 RepID=A0A8K0A8T3_BRALA|nr:SSTR2 [Branchiostoma lanceolatum]